jgi:hypothetical protein
MSDRDDAWTVAAIAVLAFIAADVAHEVIGHGAGLRAVGGRACVLTTTRLIVADPSGPRSLGDLGGRVFSIGGPLGGAGEAADAPPAPASVAPSAGWIVAALLAAALYVGVLGPGVPVTF